MAHIQDNPTPCRVVDIEPEYHVGFPLAVARGKVCQITSRIDAARGFQQILSYRLNSGAPVCEAAEDVLRRVTEGLLAELEAAYGLSEGLLKAITGRGK
jgi:hypothetical protein